MMGSSPPSFGPVVVRRRDASSRLIASAQAARLERLLPAQAHQARVNCASTCSICHTRTRNSAYRDERFEATLPEQ